VISFEEEAFNILGKNGKDPEVFKFGKKLKELPQIDELEGGRPSNITNVWFPKNGIRLIFKTEICMLVGITFYFAPDPSIGDGKFTGFYNSEMNDSSTKESILKILGPPTCESNIVKQYQNGDLIPKWMCYDYEDHTLRFAFCGDEDKLAEVNLFVAEHAPGRPPKVGLAVV